MDPATWYFLSLLDDKGGVLFANVCAGFIRFCYGISGKRRVLWILGAPRILCICGGAGFAGLLLMSTGDLGYASVTIAGHVLWAEVGGRSWSSGRLLFFLHKCAWKFRVAIPATFE